MDHARWNALDSLRGLALVWMTVFHFSFDLSQAGVWPQDFYANPWWTWQRVGIVSLFLFCAGFSQALAWAQGQTWRRFARRCLQIAACAALVSLGSWWMFPKSWIYFGVLHGMVIMLVLLRLSLTWGRWLWLAGALAMLGQPLASWLLQQLGSPGLQDWMNAPVLNWLGVITRKPVTEDYVPILPWLGVMWWGAASGQWALRHKQSSWWQRLPSWAPLAWLGRISLRYYMLHQPVMIAVLALCMQLWS